MSGNDFGWDKEDPRSPTGLTRDAPSLVPATAAEYVAPDAGMPIEHVVDATGYVWRLVHDGGMATRAHYAGIVSIGIAELERTSGPLRQPIPLDGLEETIARAQWRAVLEDYPEAATRIDFDDMPDAWRTRVLRRASLVARALAGDGAR